MCSLVRKHIAVTSFKCFATADEEKSLRNPNTFWSSVLEMFNYNVTLFLMSLFTIQILGLFCLLKDLILLVACVFLNFYDHEVIIV